VTQQGLLTGFALYPSRMRALILELSDEAPPIGFPEILAMNTGAVASPLLGGALRNLSKPLFPA
jgi:hypothetical protein